MGYMKQGDAVHIWGPVGRDATFRAFESGKKVANFSVRYGVEGHGEEKKSRFMDVKAWGELADYACNLEKWDMVSVLGVMCKEPKPDQNGRERWYLNADMVTVQAKVNSAYADDYDDDLPDEFGGDHQEGAR